MTWKLLEPSVPHRDGRVLDLGPDETQWANDLYVVHMREIRSTNPDAPRFRHLSIRRQDRRPCHDWRHFQRIKNQLCGPEWTGVEIYPAESRLVDGANQYHLWVFEIDDMGFGFQRRIVARQAQVDMATPGAVQRDPEPIDLAYGGLTPLKAIMEDNHPDLIACEQDPEDEVFCKVHASHFIGGRDDETGKPVGRCVVATRLEKERRIS